MLIEFHFQLKKGKYYNYSKIYFKIYSKIYFEIDFKILLKSILKYLNSEVYDLAAFADIANFGYFA